MDDLVERLEYHAERGDSPICYEAAAEIRSLRAQVEQAEQDRAGIVAMTRRWAAAEMLSRSVILRRMADAIERHEDKEPRA